MPTPPLPQQTPPPQGQVYYQQSAPNPPNLKKRNKGKGNHNKKSQGNKGNQGPPPNAPQGPPPNPTSQQGSQPKQKKNRHTNKPYACCIVYGNYTHDCPLLP